jgi:hypothetical protein
MTKIWVIATLHYGKKAMSKKRYVCPIHGEPVDGGGNGCTICERLNATAQALFSKPVDTAKLAVEITQAVTMCGSYDYDGMLSIVNRILDAALKENKR